MNTALVGYNGTIGSVLKDQICFNNLFNSKNIDQLSNQQYDLVYCSAPTGSRVWANNNADKDKENINSIIKQLAQSNIKKFVLISTVDTQIRSNTPYGKSRLYFENSIKEIFNDYHIVRLCSLIDSSIKKNLLYDIKHNQYLDKVNPLLYMQWYPMHRLSNDIQICINNQINEINLVSEPIQNKDILNRFCKHIKPSYSESVTDYDLVCNYSKVFSGYKQYINSKSEIFKHMEDYLDHTH